MNDKEMLNQLYEDMYTAMVKKDEAELLRIHDDSFVLAHMTGMKQDKTTYVRAIMDGTLNYYSAQTEELKIDVHGDTAKIVGRSKVTTAMWQSRSLLTKHVPN
jgi:hypothetical protein